MYCASTPAIVPGSGPLADVHNVSVLLPPAAARVAACLVLRHVTAAVNEIGFRVVGPRSVIIRNGNPALVSLYPSASSTRRRCLNSVCADGIDIAFFSSSSRNCLIIEKLGASIAVDK